MSLAIPLNQRGCVSFPLKLLPSQDSDPNRSLNEKYCQFPPGKQLSKRSSDSYALIIRCDARCCVVKPLFEPEHAKGKLELQWAHSFNVLIVYCD